MYDFGTLLGLDLSASSVSMSMGVGSACADDVSFDLAALSLQGAITRIEARRSDIC